MIYSNLNVISNSKIYISNICKLGKPGVGGDCEGGGTVNLQPVGYVNKNCKT